jgi:hypothetical protein
MRTLVDGYPLAEDAADYEIQLKIDDYFARRIKERSFGATAGRVLEGTKTKEERYAWLSPLLRRAQWQMDHPEQAQKYWPNHLTVTASHLMNHNRQQTEEELLMLLGYSALFRHIQDFGCLNEFVPRAAEAFRKTADKKRWIASMESACFDFEQFETVHGGRSAAKLGMALLTDAEARATASPCWSWVVAKALDEIPSAGKWRNFFALADTELMFPSEPSAKQVAAAIKKIGPEEFAIRFKAWTVKGGAGEPLFLSWRGVSILKMLLHGAAELGADTVQAPLEALTGCVWRQPERGELILDLLVAALSRQVRSFAGPCLEILASHPYAAGNAALKTAIPERIPEVIGIDGYPLDSAPERAVFHHRIDRWLRGGPDLLQRQTNAPDLHTLALAEEGPDYAGLFRAMLDRYCWFHQNAGLLPDRTKW